MSGDDRPDVCRFWTKDYITGVSALISCVDSDINRLEKEAKFYKWFTDDWSKKVLQGLGKAAEDTALAEHGALCDLTVDLKRFLNVEMLEDRCSRPLQATVKRTKEVRQDVEQQLKSLYAIYATDLKAVSDSVNLYTRKASAFPITESKPARPRPSSIVLDEHLKFADTAALQSFLEKIRQSMPVQRKGLMNYLGVDGNVSFQGKVMLDVIRKNTDKLDTSTFNLERLGQVMLDLKLIREDSLVIGGKQMFTQEGYFHWAQDPKEPAAGASLTGWIKGLSMTSVDDVDIGDLKESYFAKCCKLEYSKFELEKGIYQISGNYSKKTVQEINKTLTGSRNTFTKLFGRDKNLAENLENPDQDARYFARNDSTRLFKWEFEQGRLVRREMMFGSQKIDDDAVLAIAQILNHVRDFSDEKDLDNKIAKSWTSGSIVDMNRAINLKIDLINIFKETHITSNSEAVDTLIGSNRYNTVDDWIAITKIWLLEIPDSLVPPKCCELIAKNQDSWVDEIPLNNLLILIEIIKHLRCVDGLGTQQSSAMYFYFARPAECLRNFERDYKTLEPWIASLPAQLNTLQKACDDRQQQVHLDQPIARATPSILIRNVAEPMTPPPPSRIDENFIPRPFRTVSAASSAPGSPISSRASKRISGLVIELPNSPTATEQ